MRLQYQQFVVFTNYNNLGTYLLNNYSGFNFKKTSYLLNYNIM